MTAITLHGILAIEFGKTMNMDIRKPKEVIDAITMNKPSFKRRIIELAQQGIHYSLVIDGEDAKKIEQLEIKRKILQIDIVPIICGRGIEIAIIGGLMMAAGAGIGSGVLATVLITLGGIALSMGLQMALAPKPETKKLESTVGASKQSFLLSSKENLTSQGNTVPTGYGRLRVGSANIQFCVKSYPQKLGSTQTITNLNKAANSAVQSSSSSIISI
jgi:predicted phage tail protein